MRREYYGIVLGLALLVYPVIWKYGLDEPAGDIFTHPWLAGLAVFTVIAIYEVVESERGEFT